MGMARRCIELSGSTGIRYQPKWHVRLLHTPFLGASDDIQGTSAGDYPYPGRSKFKCTVESRIFNYNVDTLVDTGAQASGIDLDFMQSDPRFLTYLHRKTPGTCSAVNGILVRSEGSIIIPIKFNDMAMHVELQIIKNLIHPILLGMDFIKRNETALDFKTDTWTVKGQSIPITGIPTWQNQAPTHLTCIDDLTLEP
jgi:hypothetical protein